MSGISVSVFDSLCVDLIKRIRPKTVLDIGAGRGKYANLIQQSGLKCKTTAIEAVPRYVDEFNLRTLYDEVAVINATTIIDSWRNRCFDLVIIGDCIEHIPKSQALDLLNFLTYRSAYIIVIAPEFSFYDTSNMEHTESHISVWSEADFAWHDRWATTRSEIMQLFILRGYQASSITLDKLVADVNENKIPVAKMTGEFFKSAHLEINLRIHTEKLGDNLVAYRDA